MVNPVSIDHSSTVVHIALIAGKTVPTVAMGESFTIRDGLTSMHDWMKTQTKLNPRAKQKKKVERIPSSDDVGHRFI